MISVFSIEGIFKIIVEEKPNMVTVLCRLRYVNWSRFIIFSSFSFVE